MFSTTRIVRQIPVLRLPALTAAAIALSVSATIALAGIDENIENALKFGQPDARYGQIKFDLRYRYENDDSKNPELAVGNASTVRLRLGYLTPVFHGFQLYSEYEGNQDVGANTYNSFRNGKIGYEKIADPQQHELNQFWVNYTGIADTAVKVGRQTIALDNQRFIGDIDWRQMQQTFDALTVTNHSLPNTTIQAGYMISSRDIVSTKNSMDSQFVNMAYDIEEIGKLTAYTYLLGFANSLDFAGNPNNLKSSQTYGARFDGGAKVNDDVATLFTAEYAYQQDFRNNPIDYEADYYQVMAGLTAYTVTGKIGIEQLRGKGAAGTAFQTPLATLHTFNGWSDQFLITPDNGLRDVYLSLGTNLLGVRLEGIFHSFEDDSGRIEYGDEWDFLALKQFGKHYSLLAKYAYYDANKNAPAAQAFDTHNFWLQAGVSY